MTLTVTKLSEALGAEVSGVDVTRPLTEQDFATIRQAFIDHKVLLFRKQPLTPPQLIAFARQFGELQPHVQKKYHHPDHPELVYMTNVDKDGKFDPMAAARGAVAETKVGWHSDLAYDRVPCWATLLHSLEAPSVGGPTCFSNTHKVFEALPQDLKTKLLGHTATFRYGGKPGSFVAIAANTLPAGVDAPEPVEHPAICRHPMNGRPAVYASPGLTSMISGMTEQESDDILAELALWIDRPEFRFEHFWSPGDTIMWDNLGGVMHVGRADYPRDQRRIFLRTTVRGQPIEPYTAAA